MDDLAFVPAWRPRHAMAIFMGFMYFPLPVIHSVENVGLARDPVEPFSPWLLLTYFILDTK